MSYGFPSENFLDEASGYWTRQNQFVESKIQLQEWMLDWVNNKRNLIKNRTVWIATDA